MQGKTLSKTSFMIKWSSLHWLRKNPFKDQFKTDKDPVYTGFHKKTHLFLSGFWMEEKIL